MRLSGTWLLTALVATVVAEEAFGDGGWVQSQSQPEQNQASQAPAIPGQNDLSVSSSVGVAGELIPEGSDQAASASPLVAASAPGEASASEDGGAVGGGGGGRRRRKNRRRHRQKAKERERYEDEYDYDRDDGYGAPQAPVAAAPAQSYAAPAPSYSAPAPSYSAPAPSYGAPSYEPSYHQSSGGIDSSNFLNALAAWIPIGLFLAAIPPNLVYINSSSSGRKKRSYDEVLPNTYYYPFMDEMVRIGPSTMLTDEQCQKRILCKMAQFGAHNENANWVQKLIYYMAQEAPRSLTNAASLTDVATSAVGGDCDSFKCSKSHL